MKNIYLIITLVLLSTHALAKGPQKPLALVWNGPGVCKPACLEGAKNATKKAGFRIQFVNPEFTKFELFKEAKLWVQPGGKSVTAAKSMSTEMLENIKDFVAEGGGYVGFCAGAFISTSKIGTTSNDGFNIVPGETELLVKEGNDNKMFLMDIIGGKKRWMFYAGGPFMKITDEELKSIDGEVIARYPDGSIGGIRGRHGKGKVAVVGFHPEAHWWWKGFRKKIDKDGSDVDYAIDMIKFATSP